MTARRHQLDEAMTLIDMDVLLGREPRLVDVTDLGAVNVSAKDGDHLKTEVHAILLSDGGVNGQCT